jgi:hypothetical protein
MRKQELIKRIEVLPYTEGPIADTITINRNWILESIEQLDELEKIQIPQFVADWIANVKRNGFKFRNTSGYYEEIAPSDDVYRVMYYIFKEGIVGEKIKSWINENRDVFARAWLDGYEIEKEKRYRVKFIQTGQHIVKNIYPSGEYFVIKTSDINSTDSFTRKELEDAGFSWVFDCPGIEVQEVTDEK